MAEVDKSTLQEVDLDKAFDGTATNTKPGEQAVDVDVNGFLDAMNTELNKSATPEKDGEVETAKGEPAEKAEETQIVAEKEPTLEELRDEVSKLKLAYSESSKQGKRIPELEKQIAELEQKGRVYDQIVADPNLENMIIDYWQKGKQPSGDLKAELGLSEDFVFEPEEMFKTGTDSNKVYMESVKRYTSQLVDAKLAEMQRQNTERSRQTQIEQMKNSFAEKYGDEALQEVETFMKGKTLTLEDMYKLMTYGERDKIIAKSAATQQSEQIKRNQEKNPTLATAKSTKVQKTDERTLIDLLKSVDGGDFSF